MADDEKTRIQADDGVRPGVQLNGIYEIDELIATGGMGEVYRGHNIQTGDPVAIKLVLKEFARDQAMLALLRKEALVLNHLSHDAIVRYHVFTIDPTINRPYLAMEFVNGQSLSERMRQGPLDPADAHRMLARLASGLALAHEAGIIHRDLSPDNIVLSGGNVDKTKIIDFGIARAASIGGGTLLGGSFAGKYNFVSPEQLGMFGGEVTERSDIYSLGLVIAGALRGEPLDMNGTPVEVIEKRRLRPDLSDIDPALAPLIEAMLEPHPADRPQSAAEIVEWLRAHGQPWLMPGQRPPGGNGENLPRADDATAPQRADKSSSWPKRAAAAPPAPPRALAGTVAEPPRRRRGAMFGGLLLVLALVGAGSGAYFAGVLDGFLEPRETGDTSPPAEPEAPPATAEPAEPAAAPPASEPEETATEPAAPQATQPDVAQPQAGSEEWLAAFDGGPCFAAIFAGGDPGSRSIEGYSTSEAPFERMRQGLSGSESPAPTVSPHLIAQGQCAAADLIREVGGEAVARGPTLTLSTDQLASGQSLKGELTGKPGQTMDLLLISRDGAVYNLKSLLRTQGDAGANFNIKLTLEKGKDAALGAAPNLILALASKGGLPAADFSDPQKASELLPRLGAELKERADAGLTVGYFRLGT